MLNAKYTNWGPYRVDKKRKFCVVHSVHKITDSYCTGTRTVCIIACISPSPLQLYFPSARHDLISRTAASARIYFGDNYYKAVY